MRTLLAAFGLSLVIGSPALAATLTLGSDLSREATHVEARGADTAFWLTAVRGAGVDVPEDGQVVEVRVRGSAMREPDAPSDPATLVHFQTLGPAAPNGARTVHLTSAGFDMPVGAPGAVSTFRPENLCVPAGGAVAFNTIGGYRWGGSAGAPPSDSYDNGTPWRIFARPGPGTATAWYSKDNGTLNGDTLTPGGGSDASTGHGAVMDGVELLMQVVVATGEDRSEACGGPRRHVDGSAVDTRPRAAYVKVVRPGGAPQRPYVTRDRRFQVGVYCGGETVDRCAGTAIVRAHGVRVARRRFSIPRLDAGRIRMRLAAPAFRRLDRAGALRARVVLRTAFGTFRSPLTLER